MAEIKLNSEADEIQKLLASDRALAELLQRALNQVLEAELTEHLGAEPHERRPVPSRGRHSGGYLAILGRLQGVDRPTADSLKNSVNL